MLVFAALAFLCCSHRQQQSETPKATAIGICQKEMTAPHFSFLTFNTALATGINPYTRERLPHILAAIDSNHDTIECYNEVWEFETAMQVVALLESQGKEVFYEDTRGEGETGHDRCTEDEASDVVVCVEDHCLNARDEHFSICAMRECFPEVLKLYLFHEPCFTCLSSLVGEGFVGMKETCVGVNTVGASRPYDGANDAMLASMFPLKNRRVVRLPSYGVNRVALIATVELPSIGPVDVACTHLTPADSNPTPSSSPFDSWDDERNAQIAAIDAALEERPVLPVLLLGDINAGPKREGWLRVLAKNSWDEIVRRGFSSPAAKTWPPICSACRWNTMRGMKDNYLIDHVLVRNSPNRKIPEAVCATPVFHTQVFIGEKDHGWMGNISDHFGIRLLF